MARTTHTTAPAAPKLDPLAWLGPDSLTAWHDYRRSWDIARRSPRTLQSYGEALASLARHLGGGQPGAEVITAAREQIEDYLLHVSAQWSDGTRANRQRSLSAWFGWAVKFGILDASPLRGIPFLAPVQKAPAVLESGELRAIIATTARKQPTPGAEFCRLRDDAILRLFCEAGSPRIAEMASIDITDVDLAVDRVLLYGKGRKERRIVMSASTAQAVSRYLRARARWAADHRISSTRLWLSQVPGRDRSWALGVTGISRMVSARSMAGIGRHVHPHQFRHTAYSRWDEAGGSTNDAMALFGWSSDYMTRVYGRDTAARRAQDAARRISLGDL